MSVAESELQQSLEREVDRDKVQSKEGHEKSILLYKLAHYTKTLIEKPQDDYTRIYRAEVNLKLMFFDLAKRDFEEALNAHRDHCHDCEIFTAATSGLKLITTLIQQTDLTNANKPPIPVYQSGTIVRDEKGEVLVRGGTRLRKMEGAFFKQYNATLKQENNGQVALLFSSKMITSTMLEAFLREKERKDNKKDPKILILRDLCIAAQTNNVIALRNALKGNEKLINEYYRGLTPLHFACQRRSLEAAAELIKQGASTRISSERAKRKPLDYIKDAAIELELKPFGLKSFLKNQVDQLLVHLLNNRPRN